MAKIQKTAGILVSEFGNVDFSAFALKSTPR